MFSNSSMGVETSSRHTGGQKPEIRQNYSGGCSRNPRIACLVVTAAVQRSGPSGLMASETSETLEFLGVESQREKDDLNLNRCSFLRESSFSLKPSGRALEVIKRNLTPSKTSI